VELQHTFTVPLGIEEAWTAFNDLEAIAPCFPGATITSVEGDDFTGAAKVKLGPISLQYTGKGRWTSRDAAEYRAVIEALGKDKRGNGTAAATITAHLEPEGDGTRVVVDTDLKITGRPAQFGRGVIQDVGNKLLDQFAACLSERMGQPAHEEAPTPAEVFGDAVSEHAAPEHAAPEHAAPEHAAPIGAAAGSHPDAQPELVGAMGGGAGADAGARDDAGPRVAEDPTPPDVRADELARQSVGSPPAGSQPAASHGPAEDLSPPDVPVGDAAGEPGGPSVVSEAADVPDVPTSPLGTAPVASSAPAPAASRVSGRSAPAEAAELDLGNLVGPVLLRRYGPTAAAVVITAVVTWFLARRRR
jgi:carbon monoxide dehydrogenase subunit G